MYLQKIIDLKNLDENRLLDKNILNILKKFKISDKNLSLNINKNSIETRINFILNKISQKNVDKLLEEFIQNININNDNFKIFFLNIFKKCIQEKSFIKYYVDFIFKLTFISNEVNSIKYFIDLIENHINNIYIDFNDIIEEERYNLIILINILIKENFFNLDFINYFENLLFNQNKIIIDKYYWIELQNNNIKYEHIIKEYISGNKRENILFNLLFNKKLSKYTEQKINKNLDYVDRNKLEIENILEESIYLNSYNEILEYIKNKNKADIQIFLIILKNFKKNNNNILLDTIEKKVVNNYL